MALVSKVRTYSIGLSSGTSALASFTAGGSLPDSLPSGLRYWRYSISNFAAMVIAILVLGGIGAGPDRACPRRSEEHTSELQSLMRISYAVFCLKKKTQITT